MQLFFSSHGSRSESNGQPSEFHLNARGLNEREALAFRLEGDEGASVAI
jgi:hypothetical protein